MLATCLRSLAAQRPSSLFSSSLVVIDNNPKPEALPVVERVAAEGGVAIRHIHEPDPGIPVARNRALDAAVEMGADWLAFIDDDEEAPADWLENLIGAAIKYDVDVIQGGAVPVWEGHLRRFVSEPRKKVPREGEVWPFVSTMNVAFKISAVRRGSELLRFDEKTFRFTGGSDVEFFRRVGAAGAKIIGTSTANVIERVPAERLTFKWQLQRAMRTGGTGVAMARTRSGGISPGLRLRILAQLVLGFGKLLLLPIHLLFGLDHFERKVARDGWRMAHSVGELRASLGSPPQPYLRIEGY
jgi:glycosyltransferase involved in cell wall biosynthesis